MTYTPGEERVYKVLLDSPHTLYTEQELADMCDTDIATVRRALGRIGSENWRTPVSALTRQVGGDHYKNMKVQPWEALEAWLTPEEYRGYMKGTAIAYLAREQSKGSLEDVAKAVHTLERMLEVLNEKDTTTS